MAVAVVAVVTVIVLIAVMAGDGGNAPVTRIDPATNRVVATIPVPIRTHLATIAGGPKGVWAGGLGLGPIGCGGEA